MKYAAEEVRKSANWLYQWERDWLYQWERKAGVRNVRAMLIAYAERIEADEGAVVVAHRFLGPDGTPVTEWDDGLPDNRKTFPDLCPPVASVQYAYDRPPAQAAQGEASPGRCKACGRATRVVCDGLDGNGLGCTNAPSIDVQAVREVIAELRQAASDTDCALHQFCDAKAGQLEAAMGAAQ